MPINEMVEGAAETVQHWPTWVQVGGAGGIFGLLFWIFAAWAKRTVSSESAMTASARAEIAIIENLRSEIARLSEMNEKLHQSVFDLRNQINDLSIENAKLRSEIGQLTMQLHLGSVKNP